MLVSTTSILTESPTMAFLFMVRSILHNYMDLTPFGPPFARVTRFFRASPTVRTSVCPSYSVFRASPTGSASDGPSYSVFPRNSDRFGRVPSELPSPRYAEDGPLSQKMGSRRRRDKASEARRCLSEKRQRSSWKTDGLRIGGRAIRASGFQWNRRKARLAQRASCPSEWLGSRNLFNAEKAGYMPAFLRYSPGDMPVACLNWRLK